MKGVAIVSSTNLLWLIDQVFNAPSSVSCTVNPDPKEITNKRYLLKIDEKEDSLILEGLAIDSFAKNSAEIELGRNELESIKKLMKIVPEQPLTISFETGFTIHDLVVCQ